MVCTPDILFSPMLSSPPHEITLILIVLCLHFVISLLWSETYLVGIYLSFNSDEKFPFLLHLGRTNYFELACFGHTNFFQGLH